jgi:hypothetical protein
MLSVVLEQMILYFKNDVRRINHSLKVVGYAVAITGKEDVTDKESFTIGLAAALHDIGIKEAERKYNSTAGRYQEEEGPPIARKILEECCVETAIIDRVCYLVGNHHSYHKIDGVDFQILVEADFLVNIFEDAMDWASVESIRMKYFKTQTGIKLLNSMYLADQ